MPLRRAGTIPNTGARDGPGSAAQRHSASKTRVNALMAKCYAMHCVRGTSYPLSGSLGGTGEALLPAVAPPSIGSVMPVTQRDSSLARYSAP
jgi:hypothetical protein